MEESGGEIALEGKEADTQTKMAPYFRTIDFSYVKTDRETIKPLSLFKMGIDTFQRSRKTS